MVLLVSAGLLLTSLTRLAATDTGFDRRYLLTFGPVSHLHGMPRQAAFIDGVLEHVGALPGVESVAMTDRLPFETTPAMGIGTSLRFIGRDDSDEEPPRFSATPSAPASSPPGHGPRSGARPQRARRRGRAAGRHR